MNHPHHEHDAGWPIVLGGGKQAELLLDLMEWCDLPWQRVRLYDDSVATRTTGPRNLPLCGSLRAGVLAAIAERVPTYIALGSRCSALRHWIRSGLERHGVPLPNVIHPTTAVAPSARLGNAITIFPGSVLGPHVRIGSGTTLFSGVVIEHDTTLGENVYVAPRVTTSGFVTVGDHCFLGTACVITRESTIGARCLIGAGALVVTDLPEESVAYGAPATVRGPLRPGMDAPLASNLTDCKLGAWSFLGDIESRSGQPDDCDFHRAVRTNCQHTAATT